jgi:hypothetical protein
MAGSGIRGQFEEKFKALIRDIEDEVCLCPISPLCFLTLVQGWWSDMFYRRSPYVSSICLLLMQYFRYLTKTFRYALQPREGRG